MSSKWSKNQYDRLTDSRKLEIIRLYRKHWADTIRKASAKMKDGKQDEVERLLDEAEKLEKEEKLVLESGMRKDV